jgi:quaternary ammonium compound-resistance protein SugE
MAWAYLMLAGAFEVGFTTAMQLMKGAKSWAPHIAFVVCIVFSFVLLERATVSIPVGTAYAVWTGIGAAGTVIVGILFFAEPMTALRLIFLATLIGSVIGLRLAS